MPPVKAPKEEPIIIVEKSEEEVQVPEDSVAKVGDFDRFGMMTIKFANQLKPFDLGMLNDETVEVIVNNVRGVFHSYEDGETPADFWNSSQEQQTTRRLDTFSLSDFEYDKSAFNEAEAEWT